MFNLGDLTQKLIVSKLKTSIYCRHGQCKGLKGKARIHTDDLNPMNMHSRNQHSLAFQIPSASKEAYTCYLIKFLSTDYQGLE